MTAVAIRTSNLLGLDYRVEAERLGPPAAPITDIHSHIAGERATAVFREAADLYGVERIVSMTQLEQIEQVRRILGDRVSFVAVPNFMGSDLYYEHGTGYRERLRKFRQAGAIIAKFWAAPRIYDFAPGEPRIHDFRLDSKLRMETIDEAAGLGFKFMVHVGDPDTWFRTKYADISRYGSKAEQYEQLEAVLDKFKVPLIAAHMCGWPEDLEFLSRMLERYPHLYIDTSATKWMVRELSKHPREALLSFLTRWRGRVLFGSDIVTSDQHFSAAQNLTEMAAKASSSEEAFELYASRYWALRTLFETDYTGPSPIADPDLHMLAPERHTPTDSPPLHGKSLPPEILRTLYTDSTTAFLNLGHPNKPPSHG